MGVYVVPSELGQYYDDMGNHFSWFKLDKLKNGVFVFTDKLDFVEEENDYYKEYYGYDVKKKKLVLSDKKLNIKAVFERDVEGIYTPSY